jgi:hypothetical protein
MAITLPKQLAIRSSMRPDTSDLTFAPCKM